MAKYDRSIELWQDRRQIGIDIAKTNTGYTIHIGDTPAGLTMQPRSPLDAADWGVAGGEIDLYDGASGGLAMMPMYPSFRDDDEHGSNVAVLAAHLPMLGEEGVNTWLQQERERWGDQFGDLSASALTAQDMRAIEMMPNAPGSMLTQIGIVEEEEDMAGAVAGEKNAGSMLAMLGDQRDRMLNIDGLLWPEGKPWSANALLEGLEEAAAVKQNMMPMGSSGGFVPFGVDDLLLDGPSLVTFPVADWEHLLVLGQEQPASTITMEPPTAHLDPDDYTLYGGSLQQIPRFEEFDADVLDFYTDRDDLLRLPRLKKIPVSEFAA